MINDISNNYDPFSLSGKSVLITGASSGIGRATAIECSKMGAKVILTARNKERLQETLEQMETPSFHKIIQGDLAHKDDLQQIIENITTPLDGVVQCAGFTIVKPFQFFSERDIDSIMTVNFKAPAMLTQRLLKNKKLNKGCSIVFISSINGCKVSYVGASFYASSKGAINGLVKCMAIELASKSIRVNTVNPGMVKTNILDSDTITEEQLKEDVKRYPLGRYGNPEEIAHAVVYLLSDASKWVTGSNLLIDGGYTLL